MKQPGLFGDDVEMNVEKVGHGRFSDWKIKNNYRKGNLAVCCRWCDHFKDGKYFKCGLMGGSNSTASDIRAGFVCDKFQEGRRA